MSAFIPVVSSSPPPMDDGWEDGDDFGDFATVGAIVSPSSVSLNSNFSLPAHDVSDHWDSKSKIEGDDKSTLFKGKGENGIDGKLGFNQSISEGGETVNEDWADFAESIAGETCKDCNSGCETVLCHEKTGKPSDTYSHQSICDSAKISVSSSNVPDIISKKEQCDTISQGSLTDSGMYSNDISPAPKTGDSLNFEADFNNCDETWRDSGISPFANQPSKLSQSHSSDEVCSNGTSHKNGSSAKDQIGELIRDNDDEQDCSIHEQHEESPEPLDFKPASFSEEEGLHFENKDFEDGFNQFYDDDVAEDNVDISPKDGEECNKLSSSSGEEPDVNDTGCNNTSLKCCDESDDKNYHSVESETFHETVTSDVNSASEVSSKEENADLAMALSNGDTHDTITRGESTINTVFKGSEELCTENLTQPNILSVEKCGVGDSHTDVSSIESEYTNQENIIKRQETPQEDTGSELVKQSNNKCVEETDNCDIKKFNEENTESPSAESTICKPHTDESCEQDSSQELNPSLEKDEGQRLSNSLKNDGQSSSCDENEAFEFADFSSAEIKPADDENGGWGSFSVVATAADQDTEEDWAAFSEPTAPRFELQDDDVEDSENTPLGLNQQDDFGNFDGKSAEEDFGNFEGKSTEDDFGSFGGNSDEDDFGDFSSKTEVIVNQPKQIKVGETCVTCFPRKQLDTNGNSEEQVFDHHMLQSVAEEKLTKFEVTSSQKGSSQQIKSEVDVDMNLWNYLKDMENARGIKFSWSNSNAMNMLLKAVNIDCSTLECKKSSMPMFASGLGGVVLKPRSPADSVDSAEHGRSNHRSKAIIVDMDKPSSQATSGNQELPAVDFDWKTSGLTNPLDAHSTVPLDLDFFVYNDKGSSGISKVQQNEQAILQSLEPLNRPQKRKKTVQPLEHILANMKFIPTVSSSSLKAPGMEEKRLSTPASEIVETLRDFRFMKARVLMFPLSQQSWEGSLKGEHTDTPPEQDPTAITETLPEEEEVVKEMF